MIIELGDGEEWQLELEDPTASSVSVPFSSASSPDTGATLLAYLNGALVEKVHLSAPHSWWGGTGQYLFRKDPLLPDDKAKLRAEGGRVTIRLDLGETTARHNKKR